MNPTGPQKLSSWKWHLLASVEQSHNPIIFIFLTFGIWLIALSACTSTNHSLSRATTPPVSASSNRSTPAIKIWIDKPGMYAISGEELIANGLGDAIQHPQDLRLYHRGDQLPVWIEGKGSSLSLRFYGQSSDSIYSKERIYWLAAGGQASKDPMQDEPELRSSSPSSLDLGIDPSMLQSLLPDTYLAKIHFEENLIYLPQVEGGDHWIWLNLPAPGRNDLNFSLSSIAPGPARLRLVIWAGTEAYTNPDHHLLVFLNGNQVTNDSWDGKGQHVVEARISTESLREGTNTLTLESPGDTGAAADIIYLDSFEVDFTRQPVVKNQQIEFFSSGIPLRFTGFDGPYSVYDITDPLQVTRVVENLASSVSFTGEARRRYVATGPGGSLHPTRISAVALTPNLRDEALVADYVAVGPEELLEPLKPLLEMRASQGLKTVAVPVQVIYDQFGHGYPEPEAIHKFLQYATGAWQPAPRFLLLVGDATYDPRGYITPPEANRLPTFLIDTVFGGETASDVGFAQINDDPWPDIAVGHIPARYPDQVSLFVQKTLAYEQEAVRPAVVAIADGQSPSFRQDAQSFLDLLSDKFQRTLYAPEAGIVGANQEIKRYFESGPSFIAYFGHGSVNMWGQDRLFTTDDVASLAPTEHLPIVLNMTCLTGFYTHPRVESLAEALLWNPEGGAVAVLAPSSLTLPMNQYFLSRTLAEALSSDSMVTLGELHLSARRNVPAEDPGSIDVMQTFMLFGDPALRLAP